MSHPPRVSSPLCASFPRLSSGGRSCRPFEESGGKIRGIETRALAGVRFSFSKVWGGLLTHASRRASGSELAGALLLSLLSTEPDAKFRLSMGLLSSHQGRREAPLVARRQGLTQTLDVATHGRYQTSSRVLGAGCSASCRRAGGAGWHGCRVDRRKHVLHSGCRQCGHKLPVTCQAGSPHGHSEPGGGPSMLMAIIVPAGTTNRRGRKSGGKTRPGHACRADTLGEGNALAFGMTSQRLRTWSRCRFPVTRPSVPSPIRIARRGKPRRVSMDGSGDA